MKSKKPIDKQASRVYNKGTTNESEENTMKYTDYMNIEEYIAIMSDEEYFDIMMDAFSDEMANIINEQGI